MIDDKDIEWLIKYSTTETAKSSRNELRVMPKIAEIIRNSIGEDIFHLDKIILNSKDTIEIEKMEFARQQLLNVISWIEEKYLSDYTKTL